MIEADRMRIAGRVIESCSAHPKQHAYIMDRSRQKLARCARRAGKSHAAACDLILSSLLYPTETVLGIAVSAGKANELMGQPIERVCSLLGVPVEHTTVHGMRGLRFPLWGGVVLLAGCANRAECEKFRGDRAAHVHIDEPEVIKALLAYLLGEVLAPRLLDLNGILSMSGSPGPVLGGEFYESDAGEVRKFWSQHHWNILDNPFIPEERKLRFIEEKRKSMTTGAFTREILGEWFHDPDSLCFPYDPARNRVWAQDVKAALGAYDVRTIIGVDIGYNDPCSFSILRYVHGIPKVYVVRSYAKSGLTPSAAAVEVKRLREEFPGCRIVADSGGMGKGYVEEWRANHLVPCEAASKTDKAGSIAEVAGALKSGALQVLASECGDLVDEWGSVTWNDQRTDVREGAIDHCSDGVRYAFRAIGGLRSNPEVELTAEERMAREDEREKERVHREAAREARRAPMVIRRGR